MSPQPAESHSLPPGKSPVGRAGAWIALVGGGSAWMIHLLLAYVIAEFGCLAGLGERHIAGFSVVTWLLLAASVLAIALAVAATLTASRFRHRTLLPPRRVSESAEAFAFTGQLAFVTNLVFLLVIVVQSIPIFYFVRGC